MKMLIDGYIVGLGLLLGSIGLWFCLAYVGWMDLIVYLLGAVMMASIAGAVIFYQTYFRPKEKLGESTPFKGGRWSK